MTSEPVGEPLLQPRERLNQRAGGLQQQAEDLRDQPHLGDEHLPRALYELGQHRAELGRDAVDHARELLDNRRDRRNGGGERLAHGRGQVFQGGTELGDDARIECLRELGRNGRHNPDDGGSLAETAGECAP